MLFPSWTQAEHHNKHHWYIVASLQRNLNAQHWLQAWLAKSLTLCSPVCSLGCCRLSGSKLLGWNTGCIDRRDYRGLDRERRYENIKSAQAALCHHDDRGTTDKTNCGCSLYSLTSNTLQASRMLPLNTLVYTLMFSCTFGPWIGGPFKLYTSRNTIFYFAIKNF